MAKRKHDEQASPQTPPEAHEIERWIIRLLGFWRGCGTSACRRQHACAAGDATACFNRGWDLTPERMKFELRVFIKAVSAGRPPEQALREAAGAAQEPRTAEFIAHAEAGRLAMTAAREEARKPREHASVPGSQTLSAQPPSCSVGRAEAPRVRGL